MYTCSLLLGLQMLIENAIAPVWYHDYGQAVGEARAAGKPLAVFISHGGNGPGNHSTEGKLGPEVRRVLAEFYVCLYLDGARPGHRELIVAFEGGESPLLVLSDRSITYQALHHAGKIDNTQLAQVLKECQAREEVAAAPPEEPSTVQCRT
jgi:hypothetical protein